MIIANDTNDSLSCCLYNWILNIIAFESEKMNIDLKFQ